MHSNDDITTELIEQAKTRASAFSVDEGDYLFNKSELDELLKEMAREQRKADIETIKNMQPHNSKNNVMNNLQNTPLVTNNH